MKVTGLAIIPPAAAADNPTVTPELLASLLAKYSRSNIGIEAILDGVDKNNPDAAVDRIFKFVDYGHASIGGLTGGIAIAVDDCSMYLAYKIFEIAQLVDGQESSTRYIEMKPSSLLTPEEAGIPAELRDEWKSVMEEAFTHYQECYNNLDKEAKENPEKCRIPESAPEKVKERMLKNYALDRARYFIPMATKTSAAYIMTARVWAETLRQLESLPLEEGRLAVRLLRRELEKFSPRLIRHSYPDSASTAIATAELNLSQESILKNGVPTDHLPDEVFCSIDEDLPSFLPDFNPLDNDFEGKNNRYSRVGAGVRRRNVRFAFNNIALAELRDLNRHRSGHRWTPFIPCGFYLPSELNREIYSDFFKRYASLIKKLAESGTHFYGYLLGTEVAFEHTTGLDKFIYEAELRTGMGAHFRYAEHLRAATEILLARKPELAQHIELGTAEPE